MVSVIRVYRYRCYPTKAQRKAMDGMLGDLREFYNAALQERRDAYRMAGKTLNENEQAKEIIAVREARPEFKRIHVHLLQDALKRLDLAYRAFFRRVKAGQTPGFPRFKGKGRYRTLYFKDAVHGNGARFDEAAGRVRIAGLGSVKIKVHRPTEGRVKTIALTLDAAGHYYLVVCCDGVPGRQVPATGKDIGVDLGIKTFAALSDGTAIENPRHLQTRLDKLAAAQRVLCRRKKGSKRRRKAAVAVARVHDRVANARRDFHHKTALDLVCRFDTIHLENLNVRGLVQGPLARPISDAAWSAFVNILVAKAESAGRQVVKVNPRGTSQTCFRCGEHVQKSLSVRVHDCPSCGLVLDRDHNAALNIQRLGRSRQESSHVDC